MTGLINLLVALAIAIMLVLLSASGAISWMRKDSTAAAPSRQAQALRRAGAVNTALLTKPLAQNAWLEIDKALASQIAAGAHGLPTFRFTEPAEKPSLLTPTSPKPFPFFQPTRPTPAAERALSR